MRTSAQASTPREHMRYQVDIHVDCSTRDMFVANRVTNISNGGLFIATNKPLPLYSEVLLKLTLDETTMIEARGKVIWNYDIPKNDARIVPGSGIKFLDLSPEHRARLEDYLNRLDESNATSH